MSEEKELVDRIPATEHISLRAWADYHNKVDFHIRAKCYDGSTWNGRLVWKKQADEDVLTYLPPLISINSWQESPTHPLSRERGGTILQVLMDDLWNCGVRPTEARGSAGQLDATHKHLRDMRKIASKFLKVSLG